MPVYQGWKKEIERNDKINEKVQAAKDTMKSFASIITSKNNLRKSLAVKMKEVSKKDNQSILVKSKSSNALTDCDKRSISIPKNTRGSSSEKRNSNSPKNIDILKRQERTTSIPVCQ